MIRMIRVLACDGVGCGGISLDVLPSLDGDNPNWQGWVPVRDESNPTQGEPIRHLCPDCVEKGNIVGEP